MARYINADALQQKITQMRLNANGNMDVINALWEVQDTILQSPTADVMENDWISIDKSFPPVDANVLLTDGKTVTVGIIEDYDDDWNPMWDYFGYQLRKITAWMPLPSPYKK